MPMEPSLPLRDIHLPAPIGWWPPAPGWWLLLVGVPALLGLLAWLWWFLRRKTVKKLALLELEAIAQSNSDGREKVQRLAILLRRICLSIYPREQVASLVGADWLEFLDRASTGTGNRFSAGAGRLLIEAPYRREMQSDFDALVEICREWIGQLPGPGKASAQLKRKAFTQREKPVFSAAGQSAENPAPKLRPTDLRRFARPPTGEEAKP